MSASTSRLSYADAEAIFDAAMADDKGIRIPFSDNGQAMHLKMRLHKFRQIDREDNARTFERGHPLYGRSNYDVIRVRVIVLDHIWYVYLEPLNDVGKLKIERLADVYKDEPEPIISTNGNTMVVQRLRRI